MTGVWLVYNEGKFWKIYNKNDDWFTMRGNSGRTYENGYDWGMVGFPCRLGQKQGVRGSQMFVLNGESS